jgi:type I restriction enzyme S subunit
LLTKKRQIKQGTMQELLTAKRRLPGFEQPWISQPFGDVVGLSRERVNPSSMSIPPLCVELEHLQSGTGRLTGEGFESQQVGTKSVFKRGDVLFGKLRAYLRKYWLAEFDGVCSTEVWVLRPKGSLSSPKYLFYTVQRDDFIKAASTAYGTHMPRSDWKIVAEFELLLPSDVSEQVEIANVLSEMDSEITALESRLIKARALKQAMTQALLTGRIRLEEPNA